MKKYILLIFGLVMCFAKPIYAQVDQRDQWMNKYWFYRWRLINDFMVVGEGQGKSLPAVSRDGAPHRRMCGCPTALPDVPRTAGCEDALRNLQFRSSEYKDLQSAFYTFEF